MTQNLKAIKGKIYTFKDIFFKRFCTTKKNPIKLRKWQAGKLL